MLAAGTVLGPYQILAPLGAGGMGEVYRARDGRLDREVAVKVLPEALARDTDLVSRFQREARAVAALAHPNIVVLYDVGTDHDVTFAVMELLEGQNLRDAAAAASAGLPWRKAVELVAAVADGLAAAHAKGVIHGDLKPENLFLTSDQRVKILDFGLARVDAHAAATTVETGEYTPGLTKTGTVMGTVPYMSPEQLRGRPADARSDIFSLGCVLYELVAGQRPFLGRTEAEVVAAILHEEPPGLPAAGKKVPHGLERLVRHCLEKNPEARFQSTRDLAFDLRALLSDSDVVAAQPAPAARRKPAAGSRRKAITSLAVLPLVNSAADPKVEYLCDGITEGIILSLSALPRLRVMARSTVFRYKGREVDPRAVGQELKVGAVLLGHLVLVGDSLALTVELVDMADGSHLWGEQYQRRFSDLLAVQSEMALQMTEGLRLRLTHKEKKRLAKRPTDNAEAYRLYLKGRFHWNKRTIEGIKRGIAYFEQALENDPAYALAYAGLADSYSLMSWYAGPAPRTVLPRAKAAALKALEADDTLAESHVSLALVQEEFDWDWPAAGRSFQRALELNPGFANAHHWYGMYLARLGRLPEAFVAVQRAQELDVLSLMINANLAALWYYARQWRQAAEQAARTLEMNPTFWYARALVGMVCEQQGRWDEAIAEYQQVLDVTGEPWRAWLLARGYALAGRHDEAREVLARLQQLACDRFLSPTLLAAVHVPLGQSDQALACLEKAVQERDSWVIYLKVDPKYDPLREDPRFADVLRRIGLA